MITEKKTIDMLTNDSVSILTQQYYNDQKLGDNHRISYVNSIEGRAEIEANEPDEVVASVFAIWGSSPTV